MIQNISQLQLLPYLLEKIRSNNVEVQAWLERHEAEKELPLYSSADIRNAGFKAAVVDTNIFPCRV